jgi:acid phosphatase (class A)
MKSSTSRCIVVSGYLALSTAMANAATPPKSPAENVMGPPAAVAAVHYVNPAALKVEKILPPPPAVGSLAALADLETVLQLQRWRTPEQVEWAKAVERDDVFNQAGILGPWFKAQNLPLTAAFFKNLGDDIRALDAAAKKPFLRPRHSTVDKRVEPCVTIPTSTSYPSGSAMQAFVLANLCAEIFPEKQESLVARAHRVMWGRALGGVHFPSDLVAGQLLADAFLQECRKSAAFRDALDMCRREMALFSGK